jgi:N-acetyl-gamma-glutamyl-phosphate reductase
LIKTAIIGASGYTGAELAYLLHSHPDIELSALYVSADSADAGKPFTALYPRWLGVIHQSLQPFAWHKLADDLVVVFLATPHQVSHELAPKLLKRGLVVIDLSAAFRFREPDYYPAHYGFQHQHPELLQQAAYGLIEFNHQRIASSQLIAVPGCYVTAALLALLPLVQGGAIAKQSYPVINAVSGVSGAGRKAQLATGFCQVSLQPYKVFSHRHQPEISSQLGWPVVFTPHLGNYKRGILATCYVQPSDGYNLSKLDQLYQQAYSHYPLVRLLNQQQPMTENHEYWPNIQQVAQTPYCDLAWKLDADKNMLIICSALDNLLKGAAFQAFQCLLVRYGLTTRSALL